MGCNWCQGHWECDGEGGCGGVGNIPECTQQESGLIDEDLPGHKVDFPRDIPVKAEVALVHDQQHDRWDFEPRVYLDEELVEKQGGGAGGGHGRQWQINTVVTVVDDATQSEVRLRVQAYVYPQKCDSGNRTWQIWPLVHIRKEGA